MCFYRFMSRFMPAGITCVYLHIFKLHPQVPSPICPLLDVHFYWKVSFGARRLSVVQNSEVVRYSGAVKCIESTGTAVGASTVVRYTVDVRYWECPLRGSTV